MEFTSSMSMHSKMGGKGSGKTVMVITKSLVRKNGSNLMPHHAQNAQCSVGETFSFNKRCNTSTTDSMTQMKQPQQDQQNLTEMMEHKLCQ